MHTKQQQFIIVYDLYNDSAFEHPDVVDLLSSLCIDMDSNGV